MYTLETAREETLGRIKTLRDDAKRLRESADDAETTAAHKRGRADEVDRLVAEYEQMLSAYEQRLSTRSAPTTSGGSFNPWHEQSATSRAGG